MKFEGQIEEIIYQNEENSYMIATLITEEEIYTVTGYLPFVSVGDYLLVEGKFVTHPEYGRQFKIEYFEKKIPQDETALEKYLASGVIKGIGPAIAKRIINKFGSEILSIFKFTPERLSEVRGITKQRALEISEEFNEKWELWSLVESLQKFGIGPNSSKKVYDKLGANAKQIIEDNPYILVDIVYGVDFFKIDNMAIKFGIQVNNDLRIKTGIKYALLLANYNGNTCVEKGKLIEFVKEKLGVDENDVEENLISMKASGNIICEERDDESIWYYLQPIYVAEKNIAERIYMLNNAKNVKHIKNFEKELEKQERMMEIILSEKQREALKNANENNVSIITGGPGTGKTTIIKTLIDIYKLNKKKVILCAPTGRAAKKMSEATKEEAKTIHRLLEIGKIDEEGLPNVDAEFTPIDADVLVIDEMSMVDVYIMNYITKALYLGTKLVLVGDSNQLPSVGAGTVLKDLIESKTVSTINLDKIFRQAAKSDIIVNAHKVNNGEPFVNKKDRKESNNDFFYINESNTDKIMEQVISLSTGRLEKYGKYDFKKDIQVLTPTKKGALGTKELNKMLQENINPKSENKKEKRYGEVIFREGDRVMQIKNNYDIFWGKMTKDEYETGSGIFNGEYGKIEKIDDIEKQIKVEFDDGKTAWYMYSELEQLELAYAITIHKSQGSEFNVVIIALPQAAPMLLTKNLLYTGITRAKKLLIILGSTNVVSYMINNSDSKKRNTRT